MSVLNAAEQVNPLGVNDPELAREIVEQMKALRQASVVATASSSCSNGETSTTTWMDQLNAEKAAKAEKRQQKPVSVHEKPGTLSLKSKKKLPVEGVPKDVPPTKKQKTYKDQEKENMQKEAKNPDKACLSVEFRKSLTVL